MLKHRLPVACITSIAALTAWLGLLGPAPTATAQSRATAPKEAAPTAAVPKSKPKVDRNFPEILERVAFRAAKAGNHKAAAIFYRRILEHQPYKRSAKLGLADALGRLGRHQDAIRIFSDMLAANPRDLSLRSRLGVALLATGRPREALPHLKIALEGRRTVATLNQVGIAHLLAGEPETAQQYFKQGLAIRPGHQVLGNNAAIALYRSGKQDEARRILTEHARGTKAPSELRKNLVLMKVAEMTGDPPTTGFALLSAEKRAVAPLVVARLDTAQGRAMTGVGPVAAMIRPLNLGNAARSDSPVRKAARRLDAPVVAPRTPTGSMISVATAVAKSDSTGRPAAGRSAGRAVGFRVQLGAFQDAGNANAAQRRLIRGMGALFRDLGIGVEPADVAGKGRMYKLRTDKIIDRASADALCARLRARSVGCFVSKASSS